MGDRKHSPFVQRLVDLSDDAVFARKIHGWATLFWLVMAIPSALTGLKTSISYLVAVSVYAIVVGHWGGYQAAGAEVKVEQAAEEAREAADDAGEAASDAGDACSTCGRR